ELGRSAAGGAQLATGIARQLDDLARGNAFTKEKACGLRQLMRLVEDERVARREQLGDAFVAQHDVGEEQVMVDDDDVGGERVTPRAHDEAVAVVRAAPAEAVVARRSGL